MSTRGGALVAVMALAALVIAGGCSSSPPGIRVSDARIPRPANGNVGVAYLTIHNTSADDDELESATSDASGSAELMQTVRKGLVEEMVPPTAPVTIHGGASLVLRTGGSHLMLERLRSTLEVGDVVVVTLHFARAGTVRVRVPVVEPVAASTG